MEKDKPKTLAIIDGKSVFYRGYYAMPNLSTKDGTPTGGVYGFSAMALELIKRLKPDYVCVAWDKPKTNIRKRLAVYPKYKAGRKPAPPDFYAQIPILHELLEAFNWPLYELDDYEADDIMCGLAKKAAKKGIETMLITSDLDALQCVSPLTHVYALKKGLTSIERFDVAGFEAKYSLRTDQFLDLKALKGDGSDNIPGVPGIGEKTAIDLLKQYETLDGVYANVALIKDSVAKKLEAGKDSAYMSKEIARLYDDAPIELDLEEMDVNKLDTIRLREILQRLEFRSLLRNLPEGMQVTKEQQSKHTIEGVLISGGLVDLHELPLKVITSDEQLKDIKLNGSLVLHARSRGKHGTNPTILIIGDEQYVYAIDLTKVKTDSLKPFAEYLRGASATGHDIKNSFKVLLELGLPLPKVAHDTLVGSFIINSLAREQTLSEIASRSIDYDGNLENMDDEELITRAPELVAVISQVANVQGEQMSEVTSLISLAETIEWPVIPVLANMERTGMKLDCDYLHKFSGGLADKISDIEQQIYGHADQEFNISSPSQLADILFVKLNLPKDGIKKGKTGYSTAASELDKLRQLHPIIDLITQYREVVKLKNTYVDTLPAQVDEASRVHTTFNLTIASTGRLSSIDPNLQNIPVRTELGRQIRTAFVAEEGKILISADYSQFELRIAAALSGEESMINAFNKDEDIHVQTASAVHGIKPEDVTKEMRYAAKAVNFGIMYGQGVYGLSAGTGMSFDDAKAFIEKYFQLRPKLKAYIDSLREMAKNKGYVETLFGRRRPTPDVHSSNFAVREAAYRAAINMPIQGTAADLTKLAMISVAKNLEDPMYGGAKMFLQIHDSIMVEAPEDKADAVAKMMDDTMENIHKLAVKLTVDTHIGHNWGEL